MGNRILEIEDKNNKTGLIKLIHVDESLHQNCSLNTSTNICEGCGRTLDEIIEWTRMTDEEKQQVMKRLSETQIISSK